MTKRKRKAQAPVGYVWCKDQWVPAGKCAGCRRSKRCVIRKTYEEAQTNGQDIPEGKDNKGKRHKGKR